ncbi:MAG: hypothetical protein AAFV47_01470 [Pseudomonadota bacterium]
MAANAGSQVGTVKHIIVRASDGLHYVYIDGPDSNKPACATMSYWMIQNPTSEVGKSQFAMLLAAYTAGLNVKITGTNSCSVWPDGETANTVQLVE